MPLSFNQIKANAQSRDPAQREAYENFCFASRELGRVFGKISQRLETEPENSPNRILGQSLQRWSTHLNNAASNPDGADSREKIEDSVNNLAKLQQFLAMQVPGSDKNFYQMTVEEVCTEAHEQVGDDDAVIRDSFNQVLETVGGYLEIPLETEGLAPEEEQPTAEEQLRQEMEDADFVDRAIEAQEAQMAAERGDPLEEYAGMAVDDEEEEQPTAEEQLRQEIEDADFVDRAIEDQLDRAAAERGDPLEEYAGMAEQVEREEADEQARMVGEFFNDLEAQEQAEQAEREERARAEAERAAQLSSDAILGALNELEEEEQAAVEAANPPQPEAANPPREIISYDDLMEKTLAKQGFGTNLQNHSRMQELSGRFFTAARAFKQQGQDALSDSARRYGFALNDVTLTSSPRAVQNALQNLGGFKTFLQTRTGDKTNYQHMVDALGQEEQKWLDEGLGVANDVLELGMGKDLEALHGGPELAPEQPAQGQPVRQQVQEEPVQRQVQAEPEADEQDRAAAGSLVDDILQGAREELDADERARMVGDFFTREDARLSPDDQAQVVGEFFNGPEQEAPAEEVAPEAPGNVISFDALQAKNDAGQGFRDTKNADRMRELDDQLRQAEEDFERQGFHSLSMNTRNYRNALNRATYYPDPALVRDGLKTLEGFRDFLQTETDGVSNYERIVNSVGLDEQKWLDENLKVANDVLELGLGQDLNLLHGEPEREQQPQGPEQGQEGRQPQGPEQGQQQPVQEPQAGGFITLEQLRAKNEEGTGLHNSKETPRVEELSNFLRNAAEALRAQGGREELAQQVQEYGDAMNTMIDADYAPEIPAALQKLSGFKAFLEQTGQDGKNNYQRIAEVLPQGEKRFFDDDLKRFSGVANAGIDPEALTAGVALQQPAEEVKIQEAGEPVPQEVIEGADEAPKSMKPADLRYQYEQQAETTKGKGNLRELLSKVALAAGSGSPLVPVNLDKFEQDAEKMRNSAAFRELTENMKESELRNACAHPTNFVQKLAVKQQEVDACEPKGRNAAVFQRNCRRLQESMEKTGTGTFLGIPRLWNSRKYEKARTAMKASEDLGGVDTEANYQAVKAVKEYIKGHEDVRKRDFGNKRFTDCMRFLKTTMPEKEFKEYVNYINSKRPDPATHIKPEDFEPPMTAYDVMKNQQKLLSNPDHFPTLRDVAVLAAAAKLGGIQDGQVNGLQDGQLFDREELKKATAEMMQDKQFLRYIRDAGGVSKAAEKLVQSPQDVMNYQSREADEENPEVQPKPATLQEQGRYAGVFRHMKLAELQDGLLLAKYDAQVYQDYMKDFKSYLEKHPERVEGEFAKVEEEKIELAEEEQQGPVINN